MDPKQQGGVWLAPGGARGTSLRAPGRDETLPAVDDVTLREDSRREIIDGRVIELMPSEEPHGHRHFELPRVLGNLLAPGYQGAVDMLTRTDAKTEFAPDVSVYPAERDPATGGRKVEELAFEVIDTTRLATVTDKAARLVARGVRRVFIVDVNAQTVSEWSATGSRWERLAADGEIVDRCLAAPVPVGALLDEMVSDAAVVRAMKARGVPALVAEIAAGRAEGREAGRAEGREAGRAEGREAGRAEGREAGRAEGEAHGLAAVARLFERKLGRPLTLQDRAMLLGKLSMVGPERLGDVVLDLPGEALARWLEGDDAR